MLRGFWWWNKVACDYLFTLTIRVRTTSGDLSGFGSRALKGCSTWSPGGDPSALLYNTTLPWFSPCVQRTGGIHSMKHLGMSLHPSIVESTFRNQGKLTTHLNHAWEILRFSFGFCVFQKTNKAWKSRSSKTFFFSPSDLFHLWIILEDFFYWKMHDNSEGKGLVLKMVLGVCG